MANYNPPLENLPIFDNAMFIHADIPITQAAADLRYLRFPNAQGTENLLTINVAGLASMLSGLDVVDGTNKTNIDQSGANITIDNNVNNGTLIYKANNGVGVETSILSLNSTTGSLTTTGTTTLASTDLTLTTTNPPTSSAVQPLANDSSTKVPTTAWVQSAITAGSGPNLLPLNNTWTGTNDFTNIVSFSDGTDSLTIDQTGIDSFITNNQTSGTIFLKTKDGGGNMTDTLTINSDSNGIVSLANINMSNNSLDSVGQINWGDFTQQGSAYTGAWALAGSYTSTNMTINNQGQITALSNGTAPSATEQPFFYAYWQSNTSTIAPNIVVSNYGSWAQNASIKLRVNYTLTYNSNFSSIYTLDCIVDIYPYRLGWLLNYTQSTSYLVNNTLQQIALSPTPATSYYQPNGQSQYSPLGRQYWCSALQQTGANPDGYTIGANNSSVRVFTGAGGTGQFGLAINPPVAASPTCNHYMSWTILNQGTFPTGTYISVHDLGPTSVNPATSYGGSGFVSIT